MTTQPENITLIGLGSIGISFLALYLTHTASSTTIHIYDPRPDLKEHIESVLPGYLHSTNPNKNNNNTATIATLLNSKRLQIHNSLSTAVTQSSIIQEQGPEKVGFKSATWHEVLLHAPASAHLWSSTSGITATRQLAGLSASDSANAGPRLLVVHPFNPPHVMPLVEIVPSAVTAAENVEFARVFFATGLSGSHHVPVVLRREVPGFVGNRLAFVLFREALRLVERGVVRVEDLDLVVENSLGPRWAVTGPFRSYNYGGGGNGLDGFMSNLAGTVQEVWDDVDENNGVAGLNGSVYLPGEGEGGGMQERDWVKGVVEKVEQVYGLPTAEQYTDRDVKLNRVLDAKRGGG